MRVVCRSPNTGGKPLRSMNRRSDEYTLRTGVGITPSTPRTMTDRRTAEDSDGYGEDASGTATIQATSSTARTPSAAPMAASTC
jgi:hypothetical protein